VPTSFPIETPSEADLKINHIVLPVCNSPLSDAAKVLNQIPNGLSISRSRQGFRHFVHYDSLNPTANFEIRTGDTFIADVTTEGIWMVRGEIIPISYELIITSLTNFKEIMLRLQIRGIAIASELINEIPSCDSIAFWNHAIQSYRQYIPEISQTDFPVYKSHACFVNDMVTVIWPPSRPPNQNKLH
jgi:hypothetical protein